MSAKLTRCETIFVYAIAILEAARRIYIKAFPWFMGFLALGFAGGVECGTINHANAIPIAIICTILALVYVICVLIEREESRKNRLKHASSKRSKK